ncbi:MAG: peptidoglycan editing factor PgeF [Luteimonas sp.]
MSDWLEADWQAPPGVRAFTTLRSGPGESQPPFDRFNLGARCGDDALAVTHNRNAFIEQARLPSTPHWLRQVHGTSVVRVESDADPDAEPEGDAAVTSVANVVLAVLTGDCLPVVFSADDGSEIAVAHAGWRGLAAGVLEGTIAAMRTAPDRAVAWLGPAAGPQAYEIGAEVFAAFTTSDPRAESAFMATRNGHWRVDLYALARMRLRAAGVQRIAGGGLCTISDPSRFYSHRRDGRSGRMATVVFRSA